jgi:hypothetical protein
MNRASSIGAVGTTPKPMGTQNLSSILHPKVLAPVSVAGGSSTASFEQDKNANDAANK